MPDSENIVSLPTATELSGRLARLLLARHLRRAADELEQEGLHRMRLEDAKTIALAALNSIDRALDYGNPGRGIEELLSKERTDG